MKKWIRNINRKNWTPTKHSRLCANHFTPDCFASKSSITRKVVLNPSAVPTIFYPHCLKTPKPRCTRTSQGIKASVVSAGIPAQPPNVNHDHDYLGFAAQPVRVDPEETAGANDSETVALESLVTTDSTGAEEDHHHPTDSTGAEDHHHPTPRRRTDELLRTRNKLVSARKAAKIQQQKIRRLDRKVKALSALSTELKRKVLFSCSTDVEANFGGVAKEILIRARQNSKNVSVSDDLKHFAVTLYSHSPKAYEFVRESFGFVLPHFQTVKSWCRVKRKQAGTGKKGSDPRPDTQVKDATNSDAGMDMSAASAPPAINCLGEISSEQPPAWAFIPVSPAPSE